MFYQSRPGRELLRCIEGHPKSPAQTLTSPGAGSREKTPTSQGTSEVREDNGGRAGGGGDGGGVGRAGNPPLPRGGGERGDRGERPPLPGPADIRGHHCPTHGERPAGSSAAAARLQIRPPACGERGGTPCCFSLILEPGRAGRGEQRVPDGCG